MNTSEHIYYCLDTSLGNTNPWRRKISGQKKEGKWEFCVFSFMIFVRFAGFFIRYLLGNKMFCPEFFFFMDLGCPMMYLNSGICVHSCSFRDPRSLLEPTVCSVEDTSLKKEQLRPLLKTLIRDFEGNSVASLNWTFFSLTVCLLKNNSTKSHTFDWHFSTKTD